MKYVCTFRHGYALGLLSGGVCSWLLFQMQASSCWVARPDMAIVHDKSSMGLDPTDINGTVARSNPKFQAQVVAGNGTLGMTSEKYLQTSENLNLQCCQARAFKDYDTLPGKWLRRGGLPPANLGHDTNEKLWLDFLVSLKHPVNCFLDIGANKGEWTKMFTTRFPKRDVYAIEAHPKIARALRDEYKGNSRVHIVNNAIGNCSGTVDIYDSTSSSGGSAKGPSTGAGIGFLSGQDAKLGSRDQYIATIPCSTVDFLVHRLTEIYKDFQSSCGKHLIVKIDVEGFDLQVLQGMTGLLKRGAIDLLQLEYNPKKFCKLTNVHSHANEEACIKAEKSGQSNNLMNSFISLLDQFGYAVFLIGPRFLPLNGRKYRPHFVESMPIGTGDVAAFRMHESEPSSPNLMKHRMKLYCSLVHCCHECLK